MGGNEVSKDQKSADLLLTVFKHQDLVTLVKAQILGRILTLESVQGGGCAESSCPWWWCRRCSGSWDGWWSSSCRRRRCWWG